MVNQQLVPLKRMLKSQRLSYKYYIKLAYRLVKCLMYMHELGLVQANFTIDDVIVQITPSVSILMKMLVIKMYPCADPESFVRWCPTQL